MKTLVFLMIALICGCASSQSTKTTERPIMTSVPGNTAQGSKTHFYHVVETTAPAKSIWSLWMDVSRWKEWDKGLKDAQTDEPLSKGVEGTIQPLSGSAAKFSITEFNPGISYSFETELVFSVLTVQRSILAVDAGKTVFEHRVSFRGPLRWLWAQILGGQFKKALPPTMELLIQLAELEH